MVCQRCGNCCIDVGRTFWKNGDFRKYPALEILAQNTESQGEGLPCGMLQMTDGIAACGIELEFGKEAKPKICQEYPEYLGKKQTCRYYDPDFVKGRIVFNKSQKVQSKNVLGRIGYHFKRKQYGIEFEPGEFFDESRLTEIVHYLRQLQKQKNIPKEKNDIKRKES